MIEKLGITPGPWDVEIEDKDYGDRVFVTHPGTECDETTICVANYGLPDARLIAQAPAMLEALIEWCIESEKHFEPTSLFERTIGLLEKATGETWDKIKEAE